MFIFNKQRNIIVTRCDDHYFELVKALILSIKDQESLNHIEIGFMDVGISNKIKLGLLKMISNLSSLILKVLNIKKDFVEDGHY